MRQAVAFKPDSVQVQFYFGLSLMDLKMFEEACTAFREVVRIKPDFADGHLMLGKLYREKLSDPDKSLPYLKKAEKSMSQRVILGCNDLRSTRKTLFGKI